MDHERFIRERITELRIRRGTSEHRMSLELGKSGSYIRSITSGMAMPSARELFNIIDYFEMTPSEFFAAPPDAGGTRARLLARIQKMPDPELEKVETFISWIEK